MMKNTDKTLKHIIDNYILNSIHADSIAIKNNIENTIYSTIGGENINKLITLPLFAIEKLYTKYSNIDNDLIITKTCVAIGIAGWSAWTLLDSLRDCNKQCNDAQKLTIFSILQSITHELVGSLQLPLTKHRYIYRLIMSMETANYKENDTKNYNKIAYCELCRISSDKSIGVAIPLLILMMKMGADKKDVRICRKFFYHFILARQMSDDACDWQEDLVHKADTPVTRLILKEAEGCKNSCEIQKIFDDKIRSVAAHSILRESKKAIALARRISLFSDTKFIESLPQFYEQMAAKIIEDHSAKK